jgi:hypothetical protein
MSGEKTKLHVLKKKRRRIRSRRRKQNSQYHADMMMRVGRTVFFFIYFEPYLFGAIFCTRR